MLLFRRSVVQPHGQLSTALLRSFQPTRHILPLNHRSFSSEYLVDKSPTSPCMFTTRRHKDDPKRFDELLKLQEEVKRDPDTEHGIPHLQPPYRFYNLFSKEQWAYIMFGPNYAESGLLTTYWRKRFQYYIRRRASKAKLYESTLGSEWYTIVGEAKRLRKQALAACTDTRPLTPAVMRNRALELRKEGASVKGDGPRDKELQVLEQGLELLPFIERVQNGERAETVVL